MNTGANIPTLYKHRLENGLWIVGQPMLDVESVSLGYFVRTGARDEQTPNLSGVSHFLEHMIFKGTKTRDWQQLKQEFTRIGAQKNGSTSAERTVYYLRVQSEYFDRAFHLLYEMMEPRLDERDFEQEKGVILNEIARAADQPENYAHRRMMHAYFHNHPLGNYVLGTPESIQAMHIEQMRAYWHHHYGTQNMTLAVVGKFEWDHVVDLAEQCWKHWSRKGVQRHVKPFEPEQSPQTILVNKHLKQQILLLSMTGVDSLDSRYYAASLGWNILGRSGGSRLHWNVQQKGLAQVARSSFWAFDGTGIFFLESHTTPENAQHILALLRLELKRMLNEGVREDELRRAKDKRISAMVFDNETTYDQMRSLGTTWMYEGRLFNIYEEAARIEQVTTEEVMQALHSLPLLEKQVLTTWGPLDETAFEVE